MDLITHTDLDGVSCSLVGRDNFQDVHFVNYGEVTEKVFELLEDDRSFFITDLGITEKVADAIDSSANYVVYIDHHDTNKWLNKYDWAHVIPEQFGRSESATSLLFDYNIKKDIKVNACRRFVELVRSYDTWDWKSNNNIEARNLGRLFKEIGRDNFINEMKNGFNGFSSEHTYLLNSIEGKIERKVSSIELEEFDLAGHKFGVGFCEKYISEVANKLCEENPDLVGIALIHPGRKTVSLRTIKDVHVGKIAKKFGGGGHPKAAGFKYQTNLKEAIINEKTGE